MKRIFIPSDILRLLKDNDVIKPSFEKCWKFGVTNQPLVHFLIKENCLKEYIEERSKYLSQNEMTDCVFFTSFMSSFSWANTKQGFNFWSNLSQKYSKRT